MNFLWVGAAVAGPVFGEASEEMLLDLDGNWPRAFPETERGGFVMFSAGGGDFKLTHANSSLTADHYDDRLLTGRKDLKDHDIRPCPDGTWLHVATGDTKGDHDSAWVWRYNSDFTILSHATYAEASTDGSNFVDVPVVCGPEFQGFAYAYPPSGMPARFAEIGSTAEADRIIDLEHAPFPTGSSLINDRDGTLWILGGYTEEGQPARKFVNAQYDAGWTSGDHWVLTVAKEGYEAYWPQTTIRVGNFFIVAHMLRDTASDWTQQEGNLALTAFDAETWTQVDQVQLSANVAPNGGMQPFVVYDGKDGLVALYSKQLKNYAFRIQLQPEVLSGGEDTAVEDTGDSGETGADTASDTAEPADSDGSAPIDTGEADPECGCATPGPSGPPAAAFAWLLARRARRARTLT